MATLLMLQNLQLAHTHTPRNSHPHLPSITTKWHNPMRKNSNETDTEGI